MSVFLLTDFGASRVKLMLWDSVHGMLDSIDHVSPTPIISDAGCYEFHPETYWTIFTDCLNLLLNKNSNVSIESMYLCCEMHGFILVSEEGKPLTNYVSWKDERLDTSYSSNLTYLDKLKHEQIPFRKKTGMNLRSGLPFCTLWYLSITNSLPKQPYRVCSLADWILIRGGCHSPNANITLAAGTGFVNIQTKSWDTELIEFIFTSQHQITFANLVDIKTPLGSIETDKTVLKVFAGCGDMQTACYGVDFDYTHEILINLGTGSQVLVAGIDVCNDYEMRLGCDDILYRAITHIPAGRMLSIFMKLFGAFSMNSEPQFWNEWKSLTADEVLSAPIITDCKVFKAAWGYNDATGYLKVREEFLDKKIMLAGLAHSWLTQYKQAVELIASDINPSQIVLSGGLSRRGSFVKNALSELLGMSVRIPSLVTDEETFEGLLKLSKK